MPRRRSVLVATLAAALIGAGAGTAAARIWPEWTLAATYAPQVDPGFVSVAGTFSFPAGGDGSTLTLKYDSKARLGGAGLAGGLTIFSLAGTWAVDELGVQHVHLADIAKSPLFTFDGTVAADGSTIDGSYARHTGYLGEPIEEMGEMSMVRSGPAAPTTFALSFLTRMDDHGKVRGKLDMDGNDTRGSLTVYGNQLLEDGKILGKIKTSSSGLTTGRVSIVGRNWLVKLNGPVDAAGFHAECDITAAGFRIVDAPVLLAVQPGPEPPPGPVKPPKNLLENAVATIVNGQVTITHNAVPSRFFGTTAGLSITFPFSDGVSVVHADSSNASIQEPRRCIVTVNDKIYGTALAPAGNGVTFDIKRVSNVSNGVIEILATGRVYPASGSAKTVNVLVVAVVQ
jgi:hypothetical protein